MKTLIIILGILFIVILVILSDYKQRKRLSEKIKIGDKRRIFTSDERSFDIVTINSIYTNKKGKKIAVCVYENGETEDIPVIDLIY